MKKIMFVFAILVTLFSIVGCGGAGVLPEPATIDTVTILDTTPRHIWTETTSVEVEVVWSDARVETKSVNVSAAACGAPMDSSIVTPVYVSYNGVMSDNSIDITFENYMIVGNWHYYGISLKYVFNNNGTGYYRTEDKKYGFTWTSTSMVGVIANVVFDDVDIDVNDDTIIDTYAYNDSNWLGPWIDKNFTVINVTNDTITINECDVNPDESYNKGF